MNIGGALLVARTVSLPRRTNDESIRRDSESNSNRSVLRRIIQFALYLERAIRVGIETTYGSLCGDVATYG